LLVHQYLRISQTNNTHCLPRIKSTVSVS